MGSEEHPHDSDRGHVLGLHGRRPCRDQGLHERTWVRGGVSALELETVSMSDTPIVDRIQQEMVMSNMSVHQQHSRLLDKCRQLERNQRTLIRLLGETVDALADHLLFGEPYFLAEAKEMIDKLEESE
jgi:hypothetical protein